MQLDSIVQPNPAQPWVSGKVFARIHGLHPQTLTNWRYRDRLAGRPCASTGYPDYKLFGRAVRYRLDADAPLACTDEERCVGKAENSTEIKESR